MKKGYHSVFENDMYEAIDFAAENGFGFVQFDLGVPNNFLDVLSEKQLSQIGSCAADRNIEITFHGPCDNVSLFTDYPCIRKGILEQYKVILYKANILHARHLTLHTGSCPEFKKAGEEPDEYLKSRADYYENVLTENAAKLSEMSGGVLLCVENDHFNWFIRNCVSKLIHAKNPVYLTLDIPKLYLNNLFDEETYRFYQQNTHLLREAHLHDFSPEFGRHQIIGDGTIDFTKFSDLILQNDVYLNFEVRPKEAALLSMRRFCTDFQSFSH
jgi:Sugar phosphate isomerases/epimerases